MKRVEKEVNKVPPHTHTQYFSLNHKITQRLYDQYYIIIHKVSIGVSKGVDGNREEEWVNTPQTKFNKIFQHKQKETDWTKSKKSCIIYMEGNNDFT